MSRSAVLGLIVSMAVSAVGCSEAEPEGPKPPPTFPGVSLKLGAVGDPAILTGVAAQRGEWTASRKGAVEIANDAVRTADSAGDLDVIIFPGEELGNLIDRSRLDPIANEEVLPPAPTEDEERSDRPRRSNDEEAVGLRYSDIAPAYREQVSKFGTQRYALPIGGSTLVLAYRADVFKAEANVKAAKEQGITLEPPATWDNLDALARFFQGKDWDGDGSPNHGLSAALGKDAEGVADATFLARAASLGQHRDHYAFLFDSDSLEPRLESPPFVEALKALAGWKAVGPPGVETFGAAEARAAFRDGKAAMLIDRAEKVAEWSAGKPVAVAPLPGSDRVYEPMRKAWEKGQSINRPTYLPFGGGWLVGVRKGLDPARKAAALDLALYLAEEEVANRILAERAFPMLSVRASQMGRGIPDPTSAPHVDPRMWSAAVSLSLMAERVLPGLRIPDADGYLDDLSAGRAAAMAGKPAEDALKETVAAWSARSKTLGVARQVWHYRQSLNSLATLPEPPARHK